MNKVSGFQIKCIGTNISFLISCSFSSIADNDGISEKGEGKESTVKSITTSFSVVDVSESVKKQDGKRTTLNDAKADKATFQDSTVRSADKLGRNRAKGRVKEFIKIFNQGASQKPKDNSPKLKKGDNYKVVDEFNISATGAEEKTPRDNVIIRAPETSAMVNIIQVHSTRY